MRKPKTAARGGLLRLSIRRPDSASPMAATLLASVALMLLACSSGTDDDPVAGGASSPAGRPEKVRLVTTIYPLEYFARRIGGDLVDVTNLVAPGVEAHDFEPSPGDMRSMSAADVIVVNGAGFEPWIDRAVANLRGEPKLVIEASRAFSLNGASATAGTAKLSAGGVDPHYWLDPVKASAQAEAVLDALTAVAPAHREVFAKNADRLIEEIELLHDQYSSALQQCRLDTFVTSHAAFGHLASRYGLVQLPLTGTSPEAEPATASLARLTRQIKGAGVRYVLAETTGSRRLSQTVADEVGATLLDMHPLASLTPEQASRGDTYLSIMSANLESLTTALECR